MRILVPVDGSAGARRAVRHAAQLARRAGAELHLVNIQPPMPLYGPVRTLMPEPQYYAACEALAKKALNPALSRLRRAGVTHRAHVRYGEPGKTIAGEARRLKCASIVMGTRGHGALGSLVLGSVATKVVHLAEVPVTLVK